MRILLTGHLGYIGTVAVPLFESHGHEVVGLDTDLYRGSTFGPAVGRAQEIKNLALDIRDVTLDHLAGFDVIAHLAGLSNDPLGNLNPPVTDDINADAAIHLAKMAKRAGIPKFIFSSTCSNYGAAGDDFIDESAAFNPVTPYGRSKVKAEQLLIPMADEKFSPVLMRSSTAFGLSPRIRFDLVINNLTAWAFATGDILLKSDGTPWRPVVHIEDIARAFLAVAEAPREKVHLEAFNVGATQENYRVRELAEIVRDVIPNTKIRIADGAGPDLRCYRVNCDKLAHTFPDARPRWTARMGIEELYGACRQYGLKVEEFEGQRYQRLAHVKALQAADKLSAELRWKFAA